MLRKFISRVFGKADKPAGAPAKAPVAKSRKHKPTILKASEHGIDRARLSRGALGTVDRKSVV